jgi:hypothetical protein
MKPILILTALLGCTPLLAQTNNPASPESGNEATACIRFEDMASRVDAVTTVAEITESDFQQAAKEPNRKVVDSNRIDVGDDEYISSVTDGAPTFERKTLHRDAQREFLTWYNKGGQEAMLSAGMSCLNEYDRKVRETTDQAQQLDLQLQSYRIWQAVVSADRVANLALREALETTGRYSNSQTEEIENLATHYNQMITSVNAYADAVDSYVQITSRIFNRQKPSPSRPQFNFDFVRPQPITCTGRAPDLSNLDNGAINTTNDQVKVTHCQ